MSGVRFHDVLADLHHTETINEAIEQRFVFTFGSRVVGTSCFVRDKLIAKH